MLDKAANSAAAWPPHAARIAHPDAGLLSWCIPMFSWQCAAAAPSALRSFPRQQDGGTNAASETLCNTTHVAANARRWRRR